MPRRAILVLAGLALASAGCKSGKPLVAASAPRSFTPPEWHRLDEEVCRMSSADAADFARCVTAFQRLGPIGTAAR